MPEHVNLLEKGELMAADEVRLRDQVGRVDRLRPKAQMGDGARARFLGIVDEVALGIVLGGGGVIKEKKIVGADSSTRNQTVE